MYAAAGPPGTARPRVPGLHLPVAVPPVADPPRDRGVLPYAPALEDALDVVQEPAAEPPLPGPQSSPGRRPVQQAHPRRRDAERHRPRGRDARLHRGVLDDQPRLTGPVVEDLDGDLAAHRPEVHPGSLGEDLPILVPERLHRADD